MRVVLVGTDMAPVRPGAGALETLLAGWAVGLATAHEVTVVSVTGSAEAAARPRRRSPADTPSSDATRPDPSTARPLVSLPRHPARPRPGGGAGRPAAPRWSGSGSVSWHPAAEGGGRPYRQLSVARPADLRLVVDDVDPDAVVLNNRPAWQCYVAAPTLHLFHNWPDAWEVPAGRHPAELVGDAGVAAVSRSLAATVATTLGRPGADVGVVAPFVDGRLFSVDPRPEPGLVVSPNRLMVKKGVRELAAIAGHPSMRGRKVLITDHLSPWTSPTEEHRALRALVEASAAELIPPPGDGEAMATLYGRAEVVVCPSIGPEGLGLTAVEAQAVGVPVVSSGLGGLAEACLLPDLIADPSDPAAFAAAILRAAGLGPAVRHGLRETIRFRYSPATSLDSVQAAIDRAHPARRAGPSSS